MPVSEATFEQLALEDPDGNWELWCGVLRQKPPMTTEHDWSIMKLAHSLNRQLHVGD